MEYTLAQFEKLVDKHSLYPDDIHYNCIGLTGEAGEVANCIKKYTMADRNPGWVTQPENALKPKEHFVLGAKDELGDAFFYLVRVAKTMGFTMEDIMFAQERKLHAQSIEYKRTFLK